MQLCKRLPLEDSFLKLEEASEALARHVKIKHNCWLYPQIFRFNRSEVGPENLHFDQTSK